jgi:hypothetical protein
MNRGSASHERVTGRGPGAWLLLFGLFTAVLLGVLASSGAAMPDEVLPWNTVALDQMSFTMTSGPPFPGIARSFKSFSQAAQENADSRVYAGIHFRSACQDGIKLGEQIGRQTFAQLLLPYRR